MTEGSGSKVLTDAAEAASGDEAAATDAPAPEPGPARLSVRWTSVLAVSVAAFLVWLVFDAPTLQRNAQAQPVGTRRTVSLDILGPIAAVSRALQLSHVVSVADGLIGRGGGNVLVTVGPTGDHHHGKGIAPAPPPSHAKGKTVPGTSPAAKATTTTLPSYANPTPANPLRVLIIGDSLGLDLGYALQNDLANTNVVAATLDGKEATGLTRPDYYNWPAELQSDVSRLNPEVVVIMMGANDPQDFPGPPDIPYGTAPWDTLYAQRVAQFMEIAASRGASVVWVGMPPMQSPGLNAAMENINSIDQAQAAQHSVDFISSWNLLGGTSGTYTPYLEVDGQEVNVREPDGIHIAPGGGEVLSQAVMSAMQSQLHIDLPRS